jgi:hypothetical protein
MESYLDITTKEGYHARITGDDAAVQIVEELLTAQGWRWNEQVLTLDQGFYTTE